ncbi:MULTISPECIES: hypothetical protein [unclassified Nodularia (in: cyanobacteria)]|uniref:hypothetical protein n=1 Tax=unclassified Nodularia (in: cyanobacteria) TaxID=2656917 RepID=UPI001D1124CF|nr:MULTISPECIES: hypothetical protein [unclassified Nodularia (in: cyanobacteria)]
MVSDFHDKQQQSSVSDKNANGEYHNYLTSSEIKAGSKVVMTHAERQAFMKTSPLGQLFGVSHLLPEVEGLMSSNH